jgi:zinc transporter ZupT
MGNVWIALGLTVFAGMATSVGSAIAFFARQTNYRFLSVATGFSAGVMLYVSFVEIFLKGTDALVEVYGDYWGHWANAGSFFGGIALIALIDNLIPSAENPHETHTLEETEPLHDRSAPFPDFDAIAADPEHAAPGAHLIPAMIRQVNSGLRERQLVAQRLPEPAGTLLHRVTKPPHVSPQVPLATANIVRAHFGPIARQNPFVELVTSVSSPFPFVVDDSLQNVIAGGHLEVSSKSRKLALRLGNQVRVAKNTRQTGIDPATGHAAPLPGFSQGAPHRREVFEGRLPFLQETRAMIHTRQDHIPRVPVTEGCLGVAAFQEVEQQRSQTMVGLDNHRTIAADLEKSRDGRSTQRADVTTNPS